ncbi:transport permease protein [Bacteroidota bacterium]|nr:transport permease protein [Bacteroidota bacterium]
MNRRRFFGFLQKEFRHIFRDRRTMLILFGMPIVQILLFGFAITNEIKNVNVAVLDMAHDDVSRDITNRILSSEYFHLYQNLNSEKEIETAFKSGKVKEVIVFENNLAKNIYAKNLGNIQLIGDATDPNTANTIVAYTRAILLNYQQELNKGSKPPAIIQTEVRMWFNEELKGVYLFVPGVMTIIMMLVSAMMTSISLAREKETGTLEALMVSPLKSWQVILGKVIPYLVLSFSITLVTLALSMFVFHVPIRGNIFLLLGEVLLFVITALSFGILISSIAPNQMAAMLISMMGLMLPTIILSGYIFPIDNMPVPLQVISNIIPARWFISMLRDIMLKGAGWSVVWKDTCVLAFMAVVFLFLASRRFKMKLR